MSASINQAVHCTVKCKEQIKYLFINKQYKDKIEYRIKKLIHASAMYWLDKR